MTKDQELSLVKLYSAGLSYKFISAELGIPTSTLASCIRRKYKDLQSQVQNKYRLLMETQSKKLQKEFDCSETVAQALFGHLYERFCTKQKNCRHDNVEFAVKFTDLIFPKICPLLGTELDYYTMKYTSDNYPTFDRIDNNLGYIKGNVHIVSWRANRLKSNSTSQELRLLADNLDKILCNKDV